MQKNHFRAPKIIHIAPGQIQPELDFQYDQQFLRLSNQQSKGKIRTALTRLDQGSIVSGFYERSGCCSKHITNLDPSKADLVVPHIRAGGRPSVAVYWSNLAPNDGSYVAPDDEVTLAAYRKLGFRLVPVRILKPIRKSDVEGSVWIEGRGDVTSLAGLVSSSADQVAAYATDDAQNTKAIVGALVEKCVKMQDAIVAFHLGSSDELHYHQMLFAIISRHIRMLNTIASLIEMYRIEQAYILFRSAYEAFLNFYVDWIAPEFFGPRLQLLSLVRMHNGDDKQLAPLGNFKDFLENTGEKAKISGLGLAFHQNIYGTLSRMSHQSYSYLERETTDFSKEEPQIEPDNIERMLLCVNVVTLALLTRVGNDIGQDALN